MVKSISNLPQDLPDDAAAVRYWLDTLPAGYPREDCERLADACELLVRCRGDQGLDTGETQVRHLLHTADILVRLRLDAATLIAALLMGCRGHPGVGEEPPAARFGPEIAGMVEDLGRIDQLANLDPVVAAKDQHEHQENLRRLLLGIAKEVRVMLVVLAERLHLMRSINGLDAERRREIAGDTRRVYAPLANRLGIWQIKWELEDLAMRHLEPDVYKRIAGQLGGRRVERESFVAAVIAILEGQFTAADIDADVSGRPKHIYSIWHKMQRKNVDLEQIFDLQAVRVLVPDVASCYAALGVVHGLWQHIPREFDDYIATPKGNLYQSLHTAVVGPEDRPLEIQIRTWEMHRHAELGVAAHWAYKENKGHTVAFRRRRPAPPHDRPEPRPAGEDSGDFGERFESDLEPVHVYVLTPQAKVIELSLGATVLDFAYAIHSEVGNRCRGAKVDGAIVPLNQPLASGQTVEILTRKNAAPSRDWLSPHRGYLMTIKARGRVRRWFKRQDFERDVDAGRALLEKELSRLKIEARPRLEQLCRRYNFRQGEDLLAALGRGEVAVGQVAHQVGESRLKEPEPAKPPPPALEQHRGVSDHAGVIVEGVADLMTHMARCCKPVPDDPILGFVTRGRGVTIHRRDCANVRNLPQQEQTRLIGVRWAEPGSDVAYPVDLLVIAGDRKGLLRDISSVFSDAEIDVVGVNTASDRAKDLATMRFTVEVKDIAQLKQVLVKLRQVPDVLEVKRPHS